ncbi:MAG: ABC transporter ATP-binding protein [Nitrospirae bacterium]|jgi:ATP-binding cassette, subfamily B, bacterial MsbA|nr:ABC transporter ATP-binding protein [Nitrospirota bacterium]
MLEDFKRIFRLVKPYWGRVALAGILSLIVSGLNGSLAWLVKPAMDEILIKKDVNLLILLPVAVFAIFLFKGIFTFFNEYLMRSAGQKLVMDLRNKLYVHILDLPMGYFGKKSSGELISRTINDSSVLQGTVSLTLKDFFIESSTVIALAIVAIWRRWDLALISILVLPSAFYAVGKLGKRMRQISRRTQEKISLITEFLSESFAGIKIIKAFCRQENETERFKKKNKDFYRENMRAVRVAEFGSLLMEVVGGVGIAFVMWYGGMLVIKNVITVGDFFSFLAAIFLMYTPAKRLAKVNIGIQQARAPFERISNLLSEQKEKDGAEEMKLFSNEIEFKGVSFIYPYGKQKALNNINLKVKKGEVIAIVGKSGGGKTTLVNLLLRFYTPTEGNIYIDGKDISRVTLKSLRGQFAIVSQDVILFNDTVLANVAYGKPEADKKEIISALKAAYAYDFVMELPQGYNTVIGERGMRLSGGQRQRLSIARAILKNPPILILDEAMSSLDTASEMIVQKAIEDLMENRTTFVIAHRLSTIKKARRIIVLEKGRIIETGTHKELYKHEGLYKKLYELQFIGKESEG